MGISEAAQNRGVHGADEGPALRAPILNAIYENFAVSKGALTSF